MKKFELLDPFFYKQDIIKDILVRQLCSISSYKPNISLFRIEHSSNIFREIFKKTETIEEICKELYRWIGIRPETYELVKCKNINDILCLLARKREETEKNKREALRMAEKIMANSYYCAPFGSPVFWTEPVYNHGFYTSTEK